MTNGLWRKGVVNLTQDRKVRSKRLNIKTKTKEKFTSGS